MADARHTVQRLYEEVVNDGKLDRTPELLAPGFIFYTSIGDLKSRESFRSYVEAWRVAFPDVHCELIDIIQDGERIAWRVHTTGTHKGDSFGIAATGRSVEFESMHHARVRDGKLIEHWMVMDLGGVFDQLRDGT